MNAFLVYIFGIYENIVFAVGTMAFIFGGAIFAFMFFSLVTGGIVGLVAKTEDDARKGEKFEEDERVFVFRLKQYFKKLVFAFITISIVLVLTPSRNIAVAMFFADDIVNTAKEIKDSNATKRVFNIIDNSLKYIEEKSEELGK